MRPFPILYKRTNSKSFFRRLDTGRAVPVVAKMDPLAEQLRGDDDIVSRLGAHYTYNIRFQLFHFYETAEYFPAFTDPYEVLSLGIAESIFYEWHLHYSYAFDEYISRFIQWMTLHRGQLCQLDVLGRLESTFRWLEALLWHCQHSRLASLDNYLPPRHYLSLIHI